MYLRSVAEDGQRWRGNGGLAHTVDAAEATPFQLLIPDNHGLDAQLGGHCPNLLKRSSIRFDRFRIPVWVVRISYAEALRATRDGEQPYFEESVRVHFVARRVDDASDGSYRLGGRVHHAALDVRQRQGRLADQQELDAHRRRGGSLLASSVRLARVRGKGASYGAARCERFRSFAN